MNNGLCGELHFEENEEELLKATTSIEDVLISAWCCCLSTFKECELIERESIRKTYIKLLYQLLTLRCRSTSPGPSRTSSDSSFVLEVSFDVDIPTE